MVRTAAVIIICLHPWQRNASYYRSRPLLPPSPRACLHLLRQGGGKEVGMVNRLLPKTSRGGYRGRGVVVKVVAFRPVVVSVHHRKARCKNGSPQTSTRRCIGVRQTVPPRWTGGKGKEKKEETDSSIKALLLPSLRSRVEKKLPLLSLCTRSRR